MDPLTQAALGAVAAQSFAKKDEMKIAAVAGVLGGMAPDLDVFIRSNTDSLLFLEFHRQFTHALLFIPIGGALVGALLWVLMAKIFRLQVSLKYVVIFATLGYATHGLLDACTSYGTQLYWPFSNYRAAWNLIGIIDPVPTLAWLVGMIFALRKGRKLVAQIALLIGVLYLGFGFVQNQRASVVQSELIASRGHQALRAEVKPTILNLFLWRSVYEHDGRFFTDAIRLGILGSSQIYQGESVEKFDRLSLGIPNDSRLAKDIVRFDWFSAGWVSLHPKGAKGLVTLGDVRYSILPNEIHPLWGVTFDPSATESHVSYETFRNTSQRMGRVFFDMIIGRSPDQ